MVLRKAIFLVLGAAFIVFNEYIEFDVLFVAVSSYYYFQMRSA